MKIPHTLGRVLSGIFLSAALLMLVLGFTLLSSHLQKSAFIIYWLICFLLTGIASIIALLDIALVRREQRKQQRALIAETPQDAKKEPARKSSPKK